jgi:PAS domain S-box-containing protein
MDRFHNLTVRTLAWPLWGRLGGLALLLLAGLGVRFALIGGEPGYPYLTFFVVVLIAAVLFGRAVGFLAAAASTFLAIWFFVPPIGSLRIGDLHDAGAALAFAVSGFLFVWLAAAERRVLRQRDEANAALREGEARLREVLEGIGEPFYALDPDWRFLYVSRSALAIWGRQAEDVVGRRVLDALPEAAGSAPFAALEQAMRTRRPVRLQAVSGVICRWVEVDIYPAQTGGLSVAFRDIHERKLGEERQRLLVAELTHRIKNTLALVVAIAEQTRRTVSSPDAFNAVFRDRLAALARAHEALQRDGGAETSVEAVAREALAPYGGGPVVKRIAIQGPEVRLPSGAAMALGMAFHELATNAAKHGALSASEGRVRLSWAAAQRDDGAVVWEVVWEEQGGPALDGPPAHQGFGTRLLQRGLASQIGGTVALDFARTGLRCRIDIPKHLDGDVELERDDAKQQSSNDGGAAAGGAAGVK